VTKPVDKDSLPLDKPRRTPGHPTKSHVVKTKVDGREKIIRFGEQGAETAGKPKAGESDRMKQKRASFKARHGESIAKGKSSAAWWANKVKWNEGGMVKMAAGGAMRMPRAEGAALQLIEQMRRAGGQGEEFDPVRVSMRDQQRARPARRPQAAPQAAAPLTAMQAPQTREEALPLPPTPPAMRPDENPPPEAPPNPMRFDEGNPHVATAISMAQRYNLPPSIFLSLVQQESRFDPNARSPRGAIGLGQLMPATARELGVNPLDPEQNLEGSARYLRRMLDQFGSMELALAAYNAGPGRVRRAGNTIPNIRETQRYVPSILRRAGVQQGEFAEGGLADLDQKYAEGGRVRRTLRDELRDIEAEIRGERPASIGVTVARGIGEGGGGIAGTTRRASLEPFLRPAVRVNNKIYSASGTHFDALDQVPENLRGSAMLDGNNRGFVDERGRFLNRRRAQDYAAQNNLFLENAPDWTKTSPELISEYLRRYGLLPGAVGVGAALAADEAEPEPEGYAEGGEVRTPEEEEYDRRLLSRIKAQTGRVTEPTRAEQMQALRTAGREAAEGVADVLLPQSPLDLALMAAFGPGGRAARLAGSAALASLEPSEAEASRFRRLIRAYHGSPHRFDEFDIRKIGTGEGAQAYGRGLYFAENEDIARSYRDKLSKDLFITPEGSLWSPYSLKHLNLRAVAAKNPDDLDVAIRRGEDFIDRMPPATRDLVESDLGVLRALRDAGGVSRNPGHMYEVDLHAGPREFLDWDAPLSGQSREVRESLLDLPRGYLEGPTRAAFENPSGVAASRFATGERIYRDLADAAARNMDLPTLAESPRGMVATEAADEVTRLLRNAGIPGTRYLDAGSRGVGGTYNYAVFDPEIIDIRRRYAEGGLAQLDQKYAEGGIVSAEAAKYDPDAVDALVKQIEAEYV
jgi:soluble lytic murein transglycosylase-like protein